MRAKLEQQGFEIEGSTPEACREYIRRELAKWAKLVAAAGIKAESLRLTFRGANLHHGGSDIFDGTPEEFAAYFENAIRAAKIELQ